MAIKEKTTRELLSLKKLAVNKPANDIGSGYEPRERYRAYYFDLLKKKGDYFVVTDVNAEKSLRSQASKQKALRGIDFRVEKTNKIINGQTFKRKTLVVVHGGRITR